MNYQTKITSGIEAFQWDGTDEFNDAPKWAKQALELPFSKPGAMKVKRHPTDKKEPPYLAINTDVGPSACGEGDYVLRLPTGKLRCMKPEAFDVIYEATDEKNRKPEAQIISPDDLQKLRDELAEKETQNADLQKNLGESLAEVKACQSDIKALIKTGDDLELKIAELEKIGSELSEKIDTPDEPEKPAGTPS